MAIPHLGLDASRSFYSLPAVEPHYIQNIRR